MSASVVPSTLILSRPDRFGDVVISSSCLGPVRKAYPEAKIYLLVHRRHAELFHQHPALDGIIRLPYKQAFSESVPFLERQFSRIGADTIVHLHSHAAVETAATAAHIPNRIGFNETAVPGFLSHTVASRKRIGNDHEACYNFDLLARLGVTAPAKLRPWLVPNPMARERLERKLPWIREGTPYVVIHPTAHGAKPRLTDQCWREVLSWLIEEQGIRVVLTGRETEDPLVERLRFAFGDSPDFIDGMDRLDAAETAWLMHRGKAFIGRDSGPAHLAAAMGCHSVVVVGPTRRSCGLARWTPLGDTVTVVDPKVSPRWFESDRAYQRRYFAAVSSEAICQRLAPVLPVAAKASSGTS